MAQHYKDLIAWQKAMDLVNAIYDITDAFPKRETYSLTDQIRRAAVSIPSNIAEGQARYSRPDFHRFLRMARGSLAELETQLMIAHSLGYVGNDPERSLLMKAAELGRILNALTASLETPRAQKVS